METDGKVKGTRDKVAQIALSPDLLLDRLAVKLKDHLQDMMNISFSCKTFSSQ